VKTLAVAAGALALLVAVVGTTRGVERERYVTSNLALLAEVPVFPGAHATETHSSPAFEEEGRLAGYTTLRLYALPHDVDPDDVARFYERELAARGWGIRERIDGPVVNFERDTASLTVNLESWRGGILELTVDSGG
jgi:hypothetical protein